MNRFLRCVFCTWFCLACTSELVAQSFGGALSIGGDPSPPIVLPMEVLSGPRMPTALAASQALNARVESFDIDTTLQDLGATLTKGLGVPVFVDLHGIRKAELTLDVAVTATIDGPLRSALRRILAPHALRAVIEDEGLVITADFRELTRRGIATDSWLHRHPDGSPEIAKKLNEKHSVDFQDMPLKDAVASLSKQSSIPMVIDRRALEEIGLSDDTPVEIKLDDVSLRSILKLMLRELDLTYWVRDEILHVTVIESQCFNDVPRIYFLEATGLPLGDFDHVMQLLQQIIVPDTWEALGGPSTMAILGRGVGNRPSLIISAPPDVHEQIADLMRVLRENHLGDDPVVDRNKIKPAANLDPR